MSRAVSSLLMMVCALVAALLFTSAAAAQQLTSYTTKCYTLHTDLPREEAVPYGRHMDAVFEEYSRRFKDFGPAKKASMPLYLFRNQSDYHKFLLSNGINAANTGGMFFVQPKIQGLAAWTHLSTGEGNNLKHTPRPYSQTFAVLQHEGFHQFAYNYIGKELPIWVNEGLAQYFEDGILVGDKFYLGISHSRRTTSIKNAIKDAKTIDFDALLSRTEQEWHNIVSAGGEAASLQYDQSWSIVYFLITAEKGKYTSAFEKYLKLVAQRRDSATAFAMAFGTNDTRAFRERWQEFAAAAKPDNLSAAVENMEVLGEAMKFLDQRKDPLPRTTEDLRSRLQRMGFQLTRKEPGRTMVISANDEKLYRYVLPNGGDQVFRMLPPEKSGLLPRLTASGMVPEPTLAWRRDSEGTLVCEVIYR